MSIGQRLQQGASALLQSWGKDESFVLYPWQGNATPQWFTSFINNAVRDASCDKTYSATKYLTHQAAHQILTLLAEKPLDTRDQAIHRIKWLNFDTDIYLIMDWLQHEPNRKYAERSWGEAYTEFFGWNGLVRTLRDVIDEWHHDIGEALVDLIIANWKDAE